jgi:VWFA-related protein
MWDRINESTQSGSENRVKEASVARTLLLLAIPFCLLVTPGALNAEEERPAEQEPLPSNVVEEVEVMLFQLNFLAKNRSGRPVTDLRADEIRIIDQGAPQRIAYFEPYYRTAPDGIEAGFAEVAEADQQATDSDAAPPPPAQGRWIVLFFDNYASSMATRLQAVEAAQSYVNEQLRPEDLICVVSFTGELHILQGFTGDDMKLRNAIQRVSREMDRATVNRYDELDLVMEAMERCKGTLSPSSCATRFSGAYEDERRREADALLRALTHLLRSLASISEPKMLVMFTNGFARSSSADVIDAARAVLGDRVANGMFFGNQFEMDRWYDKLVTAAVMGRTSIFTISPGGAGRNYLISAERASRLDEATNPYQVDVYSRSDQNHQAALADMARRTGGTTTQRSNVAGALNEILELSSGLYSVGYYPNRPIPSAPHDVKIKIKRGGVKAIWPRDVPRLPTVQPLVGEMTLKADDACSDQGRRALTVKLRLDIDTLMFEGLEKRFSNNFSVYLSILDGSGSKTLHQDYRMFNINYDADDSRQGGRVDPEIEQTLIVPCRELVVRASALDSVSGARIDFEEQLHQ